VVAAGVNPVEWKIRRGDMAAGAPLPAPRLLGTDIAGVVDAVGAGVTALAPGDPVLGRADNSGYAEYAVGEADDLVRKPDALDWDVAASLAISAETAYRTLGLLGVAGAQARGRTLLVHGASGGVGALAVQLAAVRGARVLGTASAANLDHVRKLGAEPVRYGEGWVERVRALAPAGVDAALDLSGKGVLAGSIALTGSADAVITIADRDAPAFGVHYSRGLQTRAPMSEVFAELLPLLVAGRVKVRIAARLPLAEVVAAHRISEEGHPGGRIVLTVRDPADVTAQAGPGSRSGG
jgi:NADPH:quinone reductase-like Zn-dependent oxidoreductase